MNEDNMKKFEKKHEDDTTLLSFWKNIQKGYAYFETNNSLPSVSVLNNGEYSFK
jgi:murein L,D-transpeptidase YafK